MNEDLAQKILGAMKKEYSGEQTIRWLANLKEELPVQINAGKAQAISSDLSVRSMTILDRFFDDFQRYCFEFNKTVVELESRVQSERARPVNLKMPFTEEPVIYQGHLTTSAWSMIVEAQENAISVFFVPTDFLLGFHSKRQAFEPHMIMRSEKSQQGALYWQIDGVPVQSNMLPTISKKLFAALIRICSGETEYTVKFRIQPEVASTTIEMPARPPGFQDRGFELLTQSIPPNMALGNAIRQQQAAIDAVSGSSANPALPQGQYRHEPFNGHSSNSTNHSNPYNSSNPYNPPHPNYPSDAPTLTPAITPLNPSSQQGTAKPSQAPVTASQQTNSSKDDRLHKLSIELNNAVGAHNQLLDIAMQELTNMSVKAMQEQDIVFVQRLIRRTAVLKRFKDSANAFLQEWQEACRE
jgi:hypothetical protein